jgi:hypothetical protein
MLSSKRVLSQVHDDNTRDDAMKEEKQTANCELVEIRNTR